jgi:hypothetical protein
MNPVPWLGVLIPHPPVAATAKLFPFENLFDELVVTVPHTPGSATQEPVAVLTAVGEIFDTDSLCKLYATVPPDNSIVIVTDAPLACKALQISTFAGNGLEKSAGASTVLLICCVKVSPPSVTLVTETTDALLEAISTSTIITSLTCVVNGEHTFTLFSGLQVPVTVGNTACAGIIDKKLIINSDITMN